MTTFVKRSRFDASAEELFAWHRRPGAFERLAPPWERVEVLEREGGIEGGHVLTRVKIGPFRVRWLAVHDAYEENRRFRDTQRSGPFRSFVHTHRFLPGGEIEDRIEYELPAGGFLAAGPVARKLARTFDYRHSLLRNDLERHRVFAGRPRLCVAVTGSSGLVGSALCALLTTGGHRVVRLKRDAITRAALDGADAVVHLAAENLAAHRWDDDVKRRIVASRLVTTRAVVDAMSGSSAKVLVSASATGIYGDRGDETLTESSAPGDGFLADLCKRWEDETHPARDRGARVVNLRIGVVMSAAGGALPKMLPPFSMGAGGVIGSGRQHVSWIGLDDLVYAIHHALFADSLDGPALAVAPVAATNRYLTKALGRVLRRPTILPVPAFAARAAFGEMADAALLASQRCRPAVLAASGFRHSHPDLEQVLRWTLGRPA